jgi:4a-hydroxytetrahydrobiopterin dehydratase
MKRKAARPTRSPWKPVLPEKPKRLAPADAKRRLSKLKGWKPVSGKALRREFAMQDFMAAVKFINAIARAAESEQHHPDLHLTGYRTLVIELSTHDAGGLTEADFVMAAKIDALPRKLKRA